jgi:DNA-binding response OmpR family regulator
VRLLKRGGADVLVKPFSYPELRARIAAVLRRSAPRRHSHPCSPAGCVSMYTTAACPSTSGRWTSQRSNTGCSVSRSASRPACSQESTLHYLRSQEGKGSKGFRSSGRDS